MSEELKPCPKCMSKVPPWVLELKDRDGTSNGWYVECEVCDLVCGRLFDTKEEAIESWNTRPVEPRCDRCIEAGIEPNFPKAVYCNYLCKAVEPDFYCKHFKQSG